MKIPEFDYQHSKCQYIYGCFDNEDDVNGDDGDDKDEDDDYREEGSYLRKHYSSGKKS